MPDSWHHQARLIAEDVGIDRDFAPRGDGETVMLRGGFQDFHAADDVMRVEEEDAHGQCFGIDRAAGEVFRFAGEELRGQRHQNARAVTGLGVGVERTAMLQVDQRVEAQLQNFAAGAAMPIGYKADAAVATFELRLIR